MPADRSTAGAAPELEIRMFGPLRVIVAGRDVDPGARRPRGVLAMLALAAGEVVSVDQLMDGLWGDDAPAAAKNAIQVYVGGLRRALGNEGRRIETVEPGYRLAIDPDSVDVVRFERLLAQRAGARRAVAEVRSALALWTAEPLADLRELPLADAPVARLAELRNQAIEDRIEHDLEVGPTDALIVELEERLRHEPFRERLWRQLMLALYRSGRQADALTAFQRARRLLDEELGLEPGPALVALERAILLQDPALDAVDVRPVRSLPALATTTFGREATIENVGRLAVAERLTTLVGPGGIGKTRVAVAVASRVAGAFDEGAIFVDLSVLDDGAGFVAEVARAVGATSESDDLEGVAAALAARHVLLVLDNVEQFDAAPAWISRLVAMTERVHVLVTSRVALAVSAEHVVPLGPLSDEDAAAMVADAIRRTTGADPSRELARALAAQIDGVPLGIELAAAACRSIAAEDVLAMLRDRIALPAGPRDLPERQRTIRSVVEWSLERISRDDRAVLDAVTVFQTPADAAAVAEVASVSPAGSGDPGPIVRACLGRLAETSLLIRDGSAYRLLQPIRDVLEDALEPSALGAARQRHAAWIGRVCADAAPSLYEDDSRAARDRLIGLLPEMRAAFAHRIDRSQHEAAARIVVDVGQIWFQAGRLHEARDLLGGALRGELSARTRAEALSLRGIYAKMVGEIEVGDPWITAGLEGLRTLAPDSVALVNALCHLADVRVGQDRTDEALSLADDAIAAARRVGDPGTVAMALDLAGYVARAIGDEPRAIEVARAGVEAARGHDRFQLADALAGLAASLGPDDPTAPAVAWEALVLADEIGQPTQRARLAVTVADVLGPIEPVEMARRLGDALATYVSIGSVPSTVDAGLALATVGAAVDPAAVASLVAAIRRRGGEQAERDSAELMTGLRDRLDPAEFARASGSGAALDDDGLSRLGVAVAAAVSSRRSAVAPTA